MWVLIILNIAVDKFGLKRMMYEMQPQAVVMSRVKAVEIIKKIYIVKFYVNWWVFIEYK